jgi:hypothetical protein
VELMIQCLDEIEDMFVAVALLWEQVRRLICTLVVVSALIALPTIAIMLTLAIASLLRVRLLYQSNVSLRNRMLPAS